MRHRNALSRPRRLANSHGAAFLLVIYFASLMLFLLGGVSLQRTMTEVRAAQVSRDSLQAFYLGEAGLDRAVLALRTDAAAVLTTPTRTNNDPVTGGSYTYSVTLTPEGFYRVASTGRAAGATNRVVALVSLASPITFSHALFANDYVLAMGTDTGSMDSRASKVFSANPISHGDLGVNRTTLLPDEDGNPTMPPLMAAENSKIQGDLYVGPGGDPATLAFVDPANSTLTGRARNAPKSAPLPPVQVPATAIDLGDLVLSKQQRCLEPGTYVVRDVELRYSSSVLCTTGPVTLYVTRNFLNGGASGAVYGQPSGSLPYAKQYSPENLRIFIAGPDPLNAKGQSSTIGGAAFTAAVVYAPQRSLEMLGGDWLGGIIVKNAFLWGKFFFFPANRLLYDEALRTQTFQVGPPLSITMWSVE